jgi:hypothetical protein
MKMFDVYPVYDVDIVRAEGSYVGTTRGQNILICMAAMPSSRSVTPILTM